MLVTPRSAGAPADDADTILRPGAPARLLPREAEPSRRLGFRLGGGEPVPLDVPSLLGRQPRASRMPAARPPRLVTVASPGLQISATHLQLHQLGESAVVTDLGSMNGTSVRTAGGESVQLRSGDSLVVIPGAVVDLGEGVEVRIVLLEGEAAS